MLARLSAFLVWAVVAATVVFWALRLTARSPEVPAHAVAVGKTAAAHADLTRLFGSTAVAAAASPEANPRFHLLGIIAPRPHGAAPSPTGVALIAVDGKFARAYAVGSPIDDDLVLQSVSLRSASIGPAQGARSVLLELPALPPAATGVLGSTGATGVGASTGIAASTGAATRPATPVAAPKAVMPPIAPPVALPPTASPPPLPGASPAPLSGVSPAAAHEVSDPAQRAAARQ